MSVTPLVAVDALERELTPMLGGPGVWVWIPGEAGSGRSELAERWRGSLNAVVVRPPALHEADAVAHGLWQAARQCGRSVDPSTSVEETVAALARQLVQEGRPLVLRLDDSWRLDLAPRRADEAGLRLRARRFLEAWTQEREISVALLANRVGSWRHPFALKRSLGRAQARLDALLDEQEWGSFAEAARRLHREIGSSGGSPSPLDLRLSVGLVALGAPVSEVTAPLFRAGETMYLARTLAQRAMPEHRQALERLARLRAPVDRRTLATALDVDDDQLPLFASCLGYGATQTRVSAPIRAGIREALADASHRPPSPEGHLALADAHASLDGVHDPAQAGADAIVHWLEKVHHLAHAGPAGAERWDKERVTAPEMLWDRARVLSWQYHRFEEAAALYERCVALDSQDAYAWHYLGFNLDRAAKDRDRAEEAYRQAVELEPTNPWYQSRRINFLIHHGRVREADARWASAMAALDPQGERTVEQPDLALHIHRWVARAWLEAGDVKRARAVLERLSPGALALEKVARVNQRVADAEEALEMGASVRPSGMPAHQRWSPTVLPGTNAQDSVLEAWYPGRVESADGSGVVLIVAVPDPDPARRRTLRKELTAKAWRAYSRSGLTDLADRFVEVGEYADGKVEIRLLPSTTEPRTPAAQDPWLLAWAEG